MSHPPNLEPDDPNQKDKQKDKKEQEFTPFTVILGRDLIFMDWTVQFGGQILGIIVGAILAGIFGVNLFKLFSPSEDNTVPADAYLFLEIGITLCVIGLSLYYINKLGLQLNVPRSIASNSKNILKVFLLTFSFIFGLAYLYNGYFAPYINKISGVPPPSTNGNGSDGGGAYVDFKTTDQLIGLFLMIGLSVGIYALLYAGLLYSLNKKVGVMDGIAIVTPAILLSFNLLSQYSFRDNLLKGQIAVFAGEFFYFFLISLITILSYHLSKRIELAIVALFIGYGFGYRAPSNLFSVIITLKWGFPNLADGINSTSDVISKTIESLEYAGLAGMVVLPLIFYQDTKRFFIKSWKTIRHQGHIVIIFIIAVFLIELLIMVLYMYLSFIFAFFAFIFLIGIVNSIITSQYGAYSYTAMLTSITESTLKLETPFIPTLKDQIKFLETKQKRLQKIWIILGTTIPVIFYYLIIYITTAITPDFSIGEIIFFVVLIPLVIGVVAFSISFYFVKDPLIKNYYTYSIKTVALIGGIVYYFSLLKNLQFTEMGTYPLLVIFYLPLIYVPIKQKKPLADLLFFLAGENKNKSIKELVIREDLDFNIVAENIYAAPPYLKIWLALIITKKIPEEAENALSPMLLSEFPAQRVTASLCLLYLKKKNYYERLINMLEDDESEEVRSAIAYGFRYAEDLPIELYRRLIDAQHYEENTQVITYLKETVAILEEQYTTKEEKEETFEEVYY